MANPLPQILLQFPMPPAQEGILCVSLSLSLSFSLSLPPSLPPSLPLSLSLSLSPPLPLSLCMNEYPHTCVNTHGGQKRALNPLEPELQPSVSFLPWVLGTESCTSC